MSDQEIRHCLRRLNELVEAAHPDPAGKVRIDQVPGHKKMIDIVGNDAGIIRWSLAMATAVILKAEFKPDLPGCMIVHDGNWLTQDSEVTVRSYQCGKTIEAKQKWHDSLIPQRKIAREKVLDWLGCALGLSITCFVVYCVISTLVNLIG